MSARDQGFSFGGSFKPSTPVVLSLPETVQEGLPTARLSSVTLQLPVANLFFQQRTYAKDAPLMGPVELERFLHLARDAEREAQSCCATQWPGQISTPQPFIFHPSACSCLLST